VYVLHCFQKKSKRGIETPRRGVDLMCSRIVEAGAQFKSLGEE
jgi:phage-related protein